MRKMHASTPTVTTCGLVGSVSGGMYFVLPPKLPNGFNKWDSSIGTLYTHTHTHTHTAVEYVRIRSQPKELWVAKAGIVRHQDD